MTTDPTMLAFLNLLDTIKFFFGHLGLFWMLALILGIIAIIKKIL